MPASDSLYQLGNEHVRSSEWVSCGVNDGVGGSKGAVCVIEL